MNEIDPPIVTISYCEHRQIIIDCFAKARRFAAQICGFNIIRRLEVLPFQHFDSPVFD
jgi:hypothetical protein